MSNCHIDSGVPERTVLKLGARKPNRQLVLDDDEKMLALVEKVADPIGFEMGGVTSSTAFMGKYKNMSPTVVLIDRFLPGDDSVCVRKLLALSPDSDASSAIDLWNQRREDAALSSPSARVFRRGFTCCGGWKSCRCGKSQSTAMYHHREYPRSSAQLKRRKFRRRCNNSWLSAMSRTDPIGPEVVLP